MQRLINGLKEMYGFCTSCTSAITTRNGRCPNCSNVIPVQDFYGE